MSKGLSSLCKTRFGDKVMILADTKAEWMITALSSFQVRTNQKHNVGTIDIGLLL